METDMTFVPKIVLLPLAVLLLITPVLLHAADQPRPSKVRTAVVVQESVAKSRPVTGIIFYDRISRISTELAGLVETVLVKQGDKVVQGTALVKLNTDILDKEISYQKALIERINLKIANAEKNFIRLERLFSNSGVSEKDHDDARFIYDDARKEKRALETTLQKLLIRKERSMISAPFDGIVLTKDVDSGSWVQQGKQLFSIGSSQDLLVRTPIAETTLQFIRRGQVVDVTINAFKRELKGTIIDIDPVADLKTKNVFLKIAIPEQPLVAENMSATVQVPVSAKQELRVFSRAAVTRFQGKDFVYTVKDGKAVMMPVNIVTYLGDRVGTDTPSIVPGMMLIVEGNERLRPNQPVVVAGEQS